VLLVFLLGHHPGPGVIKVDIGFSQLPISVLLHLQGHLDRPYFGIPIGLIIAIVVLLEQAIERVDAYIRENFGGVYLEDRPPELNQVVLKDPSLPGGEIVIALKNTARDGAT